MDKEKLKTYSRLVKSLGQVLALSKLYSPEHDVIKTKTAELFGEINQIAENKAVVFSEFEGFFMVNDEQIQMSNKMIDQLIKDFRLLGIGSMSMEPGMSLEELSAMIWLWSNAKKFQGEEEVKKFFQEKAVKHIAPVFASYKLVKEDETIVKEAEVVKLEGIPAEMREQFTQHLGQGNVAAELKKGDKVFQFLAHDAAFLSEKTLETVQAQDSPEALEKMLWSIGSYLIDEMSSVKAEQINRRVLGDLKERLLALWEKNENKTDLHKEIPRIFSGINAALEIKRLLVQYKKHKKSLDAAAGKLKKTVENLPEQSELRTKTENDLRKLGIL